MKPLRYRMEEFLESKEEYSKTNYNSFIKECFSKKYFDYEKKFKDEFLNPWQPAKRMDSHEDSETPVVVNPIPKPEPPKPISKDQKRRLMVKQVASRKEKSRVEYFKKLAAWLNLLHNRRAERKKERTMQQIAKVQKQLKRVIA